MTADVYENRQALFDAARVILDAQDCYEGETRIKKWAVVLAAHVLDGKDRLPRPSKTRFGLSEDDIIAAKTLGKQISDAITAAEAATFAAERDIPKERPSELGDMQKKAKKIYESGRFVPYAIKAFSSVWLKDEHIFKWLMASFANNFVENTREGLHLYVSGPSGLGKSEPVRIHLSCVPEEYVMRGSFSKRSILYTENCLEGMLMFQDDHVPDEDEAEIIRAILTSWADGFTHNTIERIDGKNTGVKKKVPARLTKIITNAEAISKVNTNGQDESRYVHLEQTRTKEDMADIMEFSDKDIPGIPEEAAIIKEIWRIIASEKKTITIPYGIGVNERGIWNVREFKRFKTLIKALVLLDGRTTATPDDFSNAEKLWSYIIVAVDNETGGVIRKEQEVINKIKELSGNGKNGVEMSRLSEHLPSFKGAALYRAIRGRDGSFDNPTGGILTLVPGMRVEKVMIKGTGDPTGRYDHIIYIPRDAGTKLDAQGIYYIKVQNG